MTECGYRDRLAAEFFSANGTVDNIIVATRVHAVGVNFVFDNHVAVGVTQVGNRNGLATQLFSANGAVDNIIIATRIYAIGCLGVFHNSGSGNMVDHDQARHNVGEVVAVRHKSAVEVAPRLTVDDRILKGDKHILRELCKQGNKGGNIKVCAKLIRIGEQEEDQILLVDAVFEGGMLSKVRIEPSGKIDIDVTDQVKKVKIIHIGIGRNSTRDQDIVGTAGDGDIGILAAIILTADEVKLGICQIDLHIADSGTVVTHVTVFIVRNVGHRDLVNTCTNRSFLGGIEHTVRLNTRVHNGQLARGNIEGAACVIRHGHRDTVRLIIEYGLHVFDLDTTAACCDKDGTGDHIADSDLATQLKRNIRSLDICAIGQVLGVGVDNSFAVLIHTDILISNLSGGIPIQRAAFLIVSGSQKINRRQKVAGENAVLVHIVPHELKLGNRGKDNQVTDICGGIMIGIGNDRRDQICADTRNRVIITEGERHILRHLFQGSAHAIDHVCERIAQLGRSTECFKLTANIGEHIRKQLCKTGNGDTVDNLGSIRGEQLIHPLGEIDIHIAAKRGHTVRTEGSVRADRTDNDGSIGTNTRARLDMDKILGHICTAKDLDLVGYVNLRLGGLDHKNANICAKAR